MMTHDAFIIAAVYLDIGGLAFPAVNDGRDGIFPSYCFDFYDFLLEYALEHLILFLPF